MSSRLMDTEVGGEQTQCVLAFASTVPWNYADALGLDTSPSKQ